MTHHDEDGHDDQPAPAENTDPATKADMGLSGTPAQAYSPEGMDDDGDDGGTYQPDEEE